jgi:hypothetical protein
MRIRNLKPGFFKNEVLATLDFHVRLLFQGLWCMADCEGRLEDRPERIRAELFPYDAPDVIGIDGALDSLACNDFILRYEAEGKRCILVKKFREHQALSGSERRGRSSLPWPVEAGEGFGGTWKESDGSGKDNSGQGRKNLSNSANAQKEPETEENVGEGIGGTWKDNSGQGRKNRADNGHRTTDIGDTIHPRAGAAPDTEGRSGAVWRGVAVDEIVKRVRDAHPCCDRISEMAIANGLRKYLPAIGADGVQAAVETFERHMSGAASHPNPMQKLENYWKKEAADRKSHQAAAPERQEFKGFEKEDDLAGVWDRFASETEKNGGVVV